MPTRLIREGINSSDRVDKLDWPEEVFYRRLLNKVDDHGLYDARPSFLRSTLYPTKAHRVRETDISRWLDECQAAGLILLYEAEGKPYLKVLDTRWDRRSKPKYPEPPPDLENRCKQLQTPVPVVRSRCTNSGTEDMSGKPDATPPPQKFNGKRAQAIEVLNFLNEAAGKAYRPVDANIEVIVARLNEGYSVADMRKVIVRKCQQWKGDEKMDTYLRPETLFAKKKMASYTGELVAPKP